MYITKDEKEFSDEYLAQGYIIRPVADLKALDWMTNNFIRLVADEIDIKSTDNPQEILNYIHKNVSVSNLNDFRLLVIKKINSLPDFRQK